MEKYKTFAEIENEIGELAKKLPPSVLAQMQDDPDLLPKLTFLLISDLKERKDLQGLLILKKILLNLFKEHSKDPDESSPYINAMCKVGIRAIKELETSWQ